MTKTKIMKLIEVYITGGEQALESVVAREPHSRRVVAAAVLRSIVAILEKPLAVLLLVFVFATPASAQEREKIDLTLPTAIFTSAALADWAATDGLLGRGGERKHIAAGVALDIAGTAAWNRWMGKKHPKIARAGLYIAAAVRIGFAIKAANICQPASSCQTETERMRRAFRAQFRTR